MTYNGRYAINPNQTKPNQTSYYGWDMIKISLHKKHSCKVSMNMICYESLFKRMRWKNFLANFAEWNKSNTETFGFKINIAHPPTVNTVIWQSLRCIFLISLKIWNFSNKEKF